MIFRLTILTILLGHTCFAQEVVKHTNSYRGITPGICTLADAVSILGDYSEAIATPNGHNYRFSKVLINISGADRVYINTVIIDRDHDYVSPHGLRIGDSLSKLRTALPDADYGEASFFDGRSGLTYWIKEGRIDRIVLPAATKK